MLQVGGGGVSCVVGDAMAFSFIHHLFADLQQTDRRAFFGRLKRSAGLLQRITGEVKMLDLQ